MMWFRITNIPPGEAPEWVRKAWIGLIFEVDRSVPEGTLTAGVVTGRLNPSRPTTAVLFEEAVGKLAEKNPEAAQWWRDHASWTSRLFFATSCGELLDDSEQRINERRHAHVTEADLERDRLR